MGFLLLNFYKSMNKKIIPTIIRYQPNDLNEWFVINLRNFLTAMMATINAVTKPIASNSHSYWVNEKPDLTKSNPDAASIVGSASINENSTTSAREILRKSPPIIIAPERETPGIKAKV